MEKPAPVTRKRISRPHDLRAVRSRQALKAALLKLIEHQSLEDITIKEITAEAGVSYPVFFRQFASREELLADIATEEVRELLATAYPMFDLKAPSENLLEFCKFVEARRELWKALLTGGAASAMRGEFLRISAEIGRSTPRTNPDLPVELASAYVTSGMFEILTWWLNQPEGYPIKKVAHLLDTLVVGPVTRDAFRT